MVDEKELNALRDKLAFFSEALYEGNKNAVNVLELNSIAVDLFGEVRRLQGELEEAREIAKGLLSTVLETPHHYMGLCPDDLSPAARDGDCPACQQLIQAELTILKWGNNAT